MLDRLGDRRKVLVERLLRVGELRRDVPDDRVADDRGEKDRRVGVLRALELRLGDTLDEPPRDTLRLIVPVER